MKGHSAKTAKWSCHPSQQANVALMYTEHPHSTGPPNQENQGLQRRRTGTVNHFPGISSEKARSPSSHRIPCCLLTKNSSKLFKIQMLFHFSFHYKMGLKVRQAALDVISCPLLSEWNTWRTLCLLAHTWRSCSTPQHTWRDYDEIKVDFVCNEENTLQIWRKSKLEKHILLCLWPARILQAQGPAAL